MVDKEKRGEQASTNNSNLAGKRTASRVPLPLKSILENDKKEGYQPLQIKKGA